MLTKNAVLSGEKRAAAECFFAVRVTRISLETRCIFQNGIKITVFFTEKCRKSGAGPLKSYAGKRKMDANNVRMWMIMANQNIPKQYLSVAQTAARWGLTSRRVLILCGGGRIPGTARFGRIWAIPANAEKPADARLRHGRYVKKKEPSGAR